MIQEKCECPLERRTQQFLSSSRIGDVLQLSLTSLYSRRMLNLSSDHVNFVLLTTPTKIVKPFNYSLNALLSEKALFCEIEVKLNSIGYLNFYVYVL